jgi:hypothetical protein
MSNSQIRTLLCVLCLAVLCVNFAGCKGKAAKESEQPAVKAAEEKPKEAAKPAEQPKQAAKPAQGGKGATLGPYNLAKNWMDEPGFIDHWLVVGPFPNPGERPDNEGFNVDYLKNYGGEAGHEPTVGMEIKDPSGGIHKWQQYAGTSTDISLFAIEGLGLEPQQEDILCYAACWLDSDADREVELRIGSDDGYKLWVNHTMLGEQNVYRSMEMDSETYKVKLNKGKNLILFKITQDWGEYEFMMRVVNADGKEVPGIKVWN